MCRSPSRAGGARRRRSYGEGRQARGGTEHSYWFEAPAVRSPAGRFRTLPVGATNELVLAVASCQLYAGGLFNAYGDMAGLARLDAVVHLGDYIYEYGEDGYGAATGRELGRLPDRRMRSSRWRITAAVTRR